MRIALHLEQNSWYQVTSAVTVQYTKIFKKLMIENWQQISELPSVSKHANILCIQFTNSTFGNTMMEGWDYFASVSSFPFIFVYSFLNALLKNFKARITFSRTRDQNPGRGIAPVSGVALVSGVGVGKRGIAPVSGVGVDW